MQLHESLSDGSWHLQLHEFVLTLAKKMELPRNLRYFYTGEKVKEVASQGKKLIYCVIPFENFESSYFAVITLESQRNLTHKV